MGTSSTPSEPGTLDTSTEIPMATLGPRTRPILATVEQPTSLSEPRARNVSRRAPAAAVVAVEPAAGAPPASQAEGMEAGEEPALARAVRQVPDHTVRPEEAPPQQSPVTGVVERRPESVTGAEWSVAATPVGPAPATPGPSAARVAEQSPVTLAPPKVTVHIGRVVVAAPSLAPPVAVPPVASPPSAASSTGPLSLEDYLRRRDGGAT